MRYTFPHHTPKPRFVQPDYAAWRDINIGATRNEVVELLGPPLSDEFAGNKPKPDDPYYSYGYLQMPMLPHPRTYEFLIGFDNDHKVWSKSDPFNGRLSKDGSPAVPEIITPLNESEFHHCPRILDMRWYPCSGDYPMTYTLEVGRRDPRYSHFEDEEYESNLEIPFFMLQFVGAQPGRFRVRATNSVGTSDWSEFRYFQFTV